MNPQSEIRNYFSGANSQSPKPKAELQSAIRNPQSVINNGRTAIVVGAGIGGLAVAIRLAVKGYEVKVFERNAEPGGKLSLFEKDGYIFDAGPSLFTQPRNIEELFELAGEPIGDYFRYIPVPLACRYFFENGKTINAYTDKARFAAEMQQVAGENPDAINEYLSAAERAYHSIGHVFLDHSLHRISTWFNKRLLPAISATRIRYLTESLHGYNKKSFIAAETVQIFDRFATYNGSNPFSAPAMLSMIPHLEQNEGTFYPEGGMISIPSALYKLALKKGVRFFFNTPVEKIIHEGGSVRGVMAGEEKFDATTVISNVDVYYVYRDLLKDEERAKKVLKRERSSSALIFYWGIKKEFPQLDLHNIFFTLNYQEEFKHLFDLKTLYSDPTIYINITSKMEKGHTPEGKENWFVMVNAPAKSGQDWKEILVRARKDIIEKLNRMLGEDISPYIETEITLDPTGIEASTLSHMGSLYGTSSNSPWSAFLRHPNFTGHLRGLYFTGGSVHPGGGIPLCLKSARIVADLC